MAVPKKKHKKKIIKPYKFKSFNDCYYCCTKYYESNVLKTTYILESYFISINDTTCFTCNLLLTSLNKDFQMSIQHIAEYSEQVKRSCYEENLENKIKYY